MRLVRLAIALVPALGCSGFVDPSPGPEVAGRYVLRTVAGAAVPAVVVAHEMVTVTLFADTIVLYRDGTGVETEVTTAVSPNSVRNPSYEEGRPVASAFRWERRGDALVVEFPCADTASCVPPPHRIGFFSATGLMLDYAIQWRTPLVYERVE